MANGSVVSRFGTLEKSRAEQLVGFKNGSNIGVDLYSIPRDIEWCAAARQAQSKANHREGGVSSPVPDLHELRDKLSEARSSGEVPFEITGTPREITGFLNRAKIADVELIPPEPSRN